MKPRVLFLFLLTIIFYTSYSQDTLLYEGFEKGSFPTNWDDEYVKGNVNWHFQEGGYNNYPDTAAFGNYNAAFYYQSNNGESTILITPSIDMSGVVKPELTFWHSQYSWDWDYVPYNDQLKVYYRRGADSAWVLLESYLVKVEEWVKRSIPISDSLLTNDFYIGFEGISRYGNGTCIDEVLIRQTEIVQRYVDTITVNQASEISVASGTNDNEILRIDVKVFGNTGALNMESIMVKSLNTNDDDVSGVKLYFTEDTFFNVTHPLSAEKNFSSGSLTFSSINHPLEFGNNTFWISYNLSDTAIEENILDAYIDANDITINGNTYPSTAKSPNGYRSVLSKIFFDDFESNMGWDLEGDFQRTKPLGKGGLVDDGTKTGGSTDPEFAYSGDTIIGNDLTGIGEYHGNYELTVTDTTLNIATSPEFDLFFYKELKLSFYRYLNVFRDDKAKIEVSTDMGQTWSRIWSNSEEGGSIIDNSWKFQQYNLSGSIGREDSVKIRFILGPVSGTRSYSGWNIDNFLVTGNYITKDVGVSEWIYPTSSCQLGADEYFQVKITNYGAKKITDPIPVAVSLESGTHVVVDTMYEDLNPAETKTFIFSKPVDLSQPAIYPNAYITTLLDGDEDETNDKQSKLFKVIPYLEIPYFADFEKVYSFWTPYGENMSWFHGKPDGWQLKSAYEGEKCWATGSSFYWDNDSSYIESPCFDFTNVEKPVFEFKLWNYSEKGKDGTRLEYSIDGGISWEVVDTHNYEWDWNWYGDSLINALESRGWDSISDGWITAKQLLPDEVEGQPLVKFRFHFASDTSQTWDGFAFDNVKIYQAPYDLGVVGFKDLIDDCQGENNPYLSIYMKNFGIRDLDTGEEIVAGFTVDNQPPVIDTLILSEDLAVDDSVVLQFTKPADIYEAKTYNIFAYAVEADPDFYQRTSNDTGSVSVNVVPIPQANLPDTIRTARFDTLTLVPTYDPSYEYYWHVDGSTDSVYHVSGPGLYILDISDTGGNGCSSTDTTVVIKLTPDFGVDSLLSPFSACEWDNEVFIQARIKNFGTDTLEVNDTIIAAYEFESMQVEYDTIILQSRLYPDNNFSYTFSDDPVDMANFESYNIKVFTIYKYDENETNDTLLSIVEAYGYPVLDLGPDTSVAGLYHTLDAGPGYSSYLWNNGDTTQTYDAKYIGYHYATVWDEHGCQDTDSVHVHLIIHDIGIGQILQPNNSCDGNNQMHVTLRVNNYGTDTLQPGERIDVAYKVNTGNWKTGQFNLTNEIYPGGFVDHTFSEQESFSDTGTYIITTHCSIDGDLVQDNDTLIDTVYVYPNPVVDLGPDTTYRAFQVELDAGYAPHLGYTWKGGVTTRTYTANATGVYWVTVRDSLTQCFDRDTVLISLVSEDLIIENIISDSTQCEGLFSELEFKVRNLGTTNYTKGRKIPMGYIIDGYQAVNDTIALDDNLLGYGTTNVSLKKISSIPLGENLMKVYMQLPGDMNHANDTLNVMFNLNKSPEIDLGGNEDGLKNVQFPHVLNPNKAEQYTFYLWQDGKTTPVRTANSEGLYWVRVTNNEGCTVTDSVILQKTNSIGRYISGSGVTLHPNPANESLHVHFTIPGLKNPVIQITDLTGKVIMEYKLPAPKDDQLKLDVSQLPTGVYYLKVFNNEKFIVEKFVVKRK